ncbi:hypothetical protein BN1080_01066 [Planococcus massiliensis]|uniref:NRDE family protein n=1 Tax=Planococcus massiliensis TaxID=1499687 RepID=A0A098EJY5_9BACL|nr:NRDE family protein [Planococcus massiliensis]CEG22145.1 hypothetical protein BN1080_01066 [Planococcus massiliensis]
MCLINFSFQDHPRYKLVIAANRDEFYKRPTEKAHYWNDAPNLLAGRDLLQMGTWLGVTKTGRIAALTNFRDPSMPETGKLSRGAIVRNFLSTNASPEVFLGSLIAEDYTGFNLIAGTADELFYYSNIDNRLSSIDQGVHGLSNHFLNTPWPKVVKGKKHLERYLSAHLELDLDQLFELLADAEQADETALPNTGVGLEFEKILSPMFIKTADYGTRSSTIVAVDMDNHLTFAERVYQNGHLKGEQVFNFKISHS